MPPRMRRKPGATISKWDGRPFHILALDPGGGTGCASAEFDPPIDQSLSLETIKFRQWEIKKRPHHVQLWSTLGAHHYTHIIWESFEFRQHVYVDDDGVVHQSRNKIELISREYIGVLELFCELHGIPKHSRTASSAKRFVTDEKIKQLGLWLPGMPHAMDATRHLLRFMVVVKKIQSPFVDIWLADD